MKTTILLLTMTLAVGFTSEAQQRVKERDLKGHWQMVIDIDEEEIEDELRDPDIPWLGRVFAKSLTSLVFGIIDEIDVEMQFKDNNRLKVVIEAFGEREVEYGRWYIDRDGALILDDFEHINVGDNHEDDQDIWLMKNGRLVAYEQHGKRLDRQPVYLRRID